MKSNTEKGFSLIELLLVVVIIGIVAAIAIPNLQKGIWAAENGSALGVLRTVSSTQMGFYVQHGRFGRLAEINQRLGNSVGAVVGDRLVRARYTFEMTPLVPTDAELRTSYIVTATRAVPGDVTYKYELNQTGQILQILP